MSYINPIRVFALLAARGVGWDAIRGGKGFDIGDCMALCSGMPRKQFHAGLVVYGKDDSQRTASDLYGAILNEAARLKIKEKWRDKPKYLDNMVRLAIIELRNPLKRANATKRDDGAFGDGMDFVRAKELGIQPSEFSRTWGGRYYAIWAIGHEWANSAYNHIDSMQR